MINTIIGIGITYGVCYVIVAVICAIISLFVCGYQVNKIKGVFKVVNSLGLIGFGILFAIVSIFATAMVVINSGMIAIALIGGNIGQIGQQFLKETIITFGIDVVSIIAIVVIIKILFNILMTKEEREDFVKDIKQQMLG